METSFKVEEISGIGEYSKREIVNARGQKEPGDVYVAGKVSKIHVSKGVEQLFTEQYGNASFWISDDGVYTDGLAKDFEAYQVYYLGNKKWVEGDTQIAVGDEVILHGQLTKYNTTYETVGKKAYIYSLNGKTE